MCHNNRCSRCAPSKHSSWMCQTVVLSLGAIKTQLLDVPNRGIVARRPQNTALGCAKPWYCRSAPSKHSSWMCQTVVLSLGAIKTQLIDRCTVTCQHSVHSRQPTSPAKGTRRPRRSEQRFLWIETKWAFDISEIRLREIVDWE